MRILCAAVVQIEQLESSWAADQAALHRATARARFFEDQVMQLRDMIGSMLREAPAEAPAEAPSPAPVDVSADTGPTPADLARRQPRQPIYDHSDSSGAAATATVGASPPEIPALSLGGASKQSSTKASAAQPAAQPGKADKDKEKAPPPLQVPSPQPPSQQPAAIAAPSSGAGAAADTAAAAPTTTPPKAAEAPLPAGWESVDGPTGTYYYHRDTRETSWTRPS